MLCRYTSKFIRAICVPHRYENDLMFILSIDMDAGKIACMKQLGITESWAVKRQVLLSAAEAAEMILRVDDILRAAPRKRNPDHGRC